MWDIPHIDTPNIKLTAAMSWKILTIMIQSERNYYEDKIFKGEY